MVGLLLPLLCALSLAEAAVEVGVFTATDGGFAMRGLYLWASVRRQPGGPWRISFETDQGVRSDPDAL